MLNTNEKSNLFFGKDVKSITVAEIKEGLDILVAHCPSVMKAVFESYLKRLVHTPTLDFDDNISEVDSDNLNNMPYVSSSRTNNLNTEDSGRSQGHSYPYQIFYLTKLFGWQLVKDFDNTELYFDTKSNALEWLRTNFSDDISMADNIKLVQTLPLRAKLTFTIEGEE